MKKTNWTIGIATLVIGVATPPGPSSAQDGQGPTPVESLGDERPIEEIEVLGRRPVTATSTMTIPADSFDLRPLESGGQMLEAVPNLITAQHTGGGVVVSRDLCAFL